MNPTPVRSIGRIASWTREDSALDPMFRRRLFAANRSMIIVCRLTDGDFPPAHTHDFDQITTVVRGQLEIRLDGERHLLAAGQSMILPAQVPHTCRASGPDGADVFHVYPPGRDPAPRASR